MRILLLPLALACLSLAACANQSLRFTTNGEVATYSGLDLSGNVSFSWELWVNVRAFPSGGLSWPFMHAGPCGHHQCLFFGFRSDGVAMFGLIQDDLVAGPYLQDRDKWVHWAGTFDGESRARRLYRNGELVASDFAKENYRPASTNLYFGQDNIGSNKYNGMVDEFRLFKGVALDQLTIKKYMHFEDIWDHPYIDSLGTFFHFNDGPATSTKDMAPMNRGRTAVIGGPNPKGMWGPGFPSKRADSGPREVPMRTFIPVGPPPHSPENIWVKDGNSVSWHAFVAAWTAVVLGAAAWRYSTLAASHAKSS